MNAELICGKLLKIEGEKVTLQFTGAGEKGFSEGEKRLIEYPCVELSEDWVIAHLGDDVTAVLIDGKIRNFR